MDKSDVEMDEVKQRIQVTVKDELETENKLPDAKVDCREGEFLTKAVMDDVNAGANVSEDLKFTEGEAKDDKNEAEHQINISSETKDPIKGKSEAVDPIESESEHNIFGSGVEEEKNSMVNGIEVASPVENMMEEDKVNGDVAKEKISNENSRRDGNPVENVGVEEKPRENAATEETSIKVNQLPTELSANEASQNEVDLVDDTPNSLVKCLPSKAGDHGGEMFKTIFSQAKVFLLFITEVRKVTQFNYNSRVDVKWLLLFQIVHLFFIYFIILSFRWLKVMMERLKIKKCS